MTQNVSKMHFAFGKVLRTAQMIKSEKYLHKFTSYKLKF